MKKIILFVAFMAALNSFGQTYTPRPSDSVSSKKKCGFGISSIYIESGKISVSQGFKDFFNSETFFQKQDNMNTGRHGMLKDRGGMMNVSQITIGAGFSPYSKKLGDYNRKMEINFGLSFASGSWVASRYNESITKPGENFISSTGTINSDTISLTNVRDSYEMSILGIDISFLARTSQEKSVSLFAGAGINTGFSISSSMKSVIKNTQDVVYSIDGYEIGSPVNYFSHAEKTDIIKSGTAKSFLLGVYAPFGIDFRLSKKHKVFSKLHIYLKGQFGAEYQQLVDGSKYYIRPSLGMGTGLKFRF